MLEDQVIVVLDIGPFTVVLQAGTFQAEADTNFDTAVTCGDIAPFIAILQGGGPSGK